MYLQAFLHHAVTLLLIYFMIGSLIWMLIYCRGSLARVYGSELSGCGTSLDGFANVLITLILIIGWPGMIVAVRRGKIQ